MATLTYNPKVFDVSSERAAREIILTREGGLNTDERWARETPYLGELLTPQLEVRPGQLIIDFGCGIGRMARELIARANCHVLGVDISEDMCALAPKYVGSPAFSAVSAEVFRSMVERGLRADAAISIWVLQHTLDPTGDIATIEKALRPGARLGIVNNIGRAVPTVEKAWASDGFDMRAALKKRFREVTAGSLDGDVVSRELAQNTFWAIYQRG